MKDSFWKLKSNPVRIVKYRFAFININSISFRPSWAEWFILYFGLISRAKKSVALVLKLIIANNWRNFIIVQELWNIFHRENTRTDNIFTSNLPCVNIMNYCRPDPYIKNTKIIIFLFTKYRISCFFVDSSY